MRTGYKDKERLGQKQLWLCLWSYGTPAGFSINSKFLRGLNRPSFTSVDRVALSEEATGVPKSLQAESSLSKPLQTLSNFLCQGRNDFEGKVTELRARREATTLSSPQSANSGTTQLLPTRCRNFCEPVRVPVL